LCILVTETSYVVLEAKTKATSPMRICTQFQSHLVKFRKMVAVN